jgi:hypothetical protein
MSKTSANGGDPGAQPPDPPAAPISGVRTEHQLRIQLKDAMERNTRFERALRESVAFAYGRRELTDLRKLKAALWAAGFPDPNPKRRDIDEGEAQAPASTSR